MPSTAVDPVRAAAEVAASVVVNPKSHRLEWLDSIRGLAALVVLVGHIFGAFQSPPIVASILGWNDGRAAVTMFFVLSGFVLALPYLTTKPGGTPRPLRWSSFYVRRFTRIWLPWFGVFLASLAAYHWWPRHFRVQPPMTDWISEMWKTPQDAGAVLRQMAYSLHRPEWCLLPQDWSLAIELKGSALMPIFILIFRARPWALASLAAGLLFFFPNQFYALTFIMGTLLAGYSAHMAKTLQCKPVALKMALLLVSLVLMSARRISIRMNLPEFAVWDIGTLGCAIFLVVALGSRRLRGFLSLSPIVFLGRISYSLYLVQFLIIICALPPLVALLNSAGITSVTGVFWFAMTAGVSLTFLVSALSYRWLEQPTMELGHWLSARMKSWP